MSRIVTIVVLLAAWSVLAYAGQNRTRGARKSTPPAAHAQTARFKDFRVPAGTPMTIRLGTDASSASSRLDDPIVGRLSAAVTNEGTELIPAGTTVFGGVSSVAAADEESGPGRLEMRFTLIEHPETKSRVGIRTTPVRFEGEYVKTKRRGLPVTRPADVRVDHGTVVSATLLEPFVVRLPQAQ